MSKEQKETIISINSNGMPMDKRDALNRKNRLSNKILTDLVTEIIKTIYAYDDKNMYVMFVRDAEFRISKEEYELLKELMEEKKESENADANKQQKD